VCCDKKVRFAAASLASLQHATTMKGGARPSGVACLVVGVDPVGCSASTSDSVGSGASSGNRCRIFRTDPSGSCLEFPHGCAIGQGADAAALVLAAAVQEGRQGKGVSENIGPQESESEASSASSDGLQNYDVKATRGRKDSESPMVALSAAEALAFKALRGALDARHAARHQEVQDDGTSGISEADADNKEDKEEEELEGVWNTVNTKGGDKEGLAAAMETAAAPASRSGHRAYYHNYRQQPPRLVALRLQASQPPPWPSHGPRRSVNRGSSELVSNAEVGALWDLQGPHCTIVLAPLSD